MATAVLGAAILAAGNAFGVAIFGAEIGFDESATTCEVVWEVVPPDSRLLPGGSLVGEGFRETELDFVR